jgi:hypothetical protein
MGGVIGHYDDGVRFIAVIPNEPDALSAFEAEEQVGRTGDVHEVDGKLRFEPS